MMANNAIANLMASNAAAHHQLDLDSRVVPGHGWTNGDLPLQFLFAHTNQGRLHLYENHRRWIGINASAGWTRIGADATELDARVSTSQTITHTGAVVDLEVEARQVKALIAQLCEFLYRCGWATGTGGGVSIRVGGPDEARPWRVFVAPSGIQKEDMIGRDIFELDMDRAVLRAPVTPHLRQSACTPLWYVVYRHRPAARCVIHTHSQNALLATLLDASERAAVLELTHLEMIKGVGNHAYDDTLVIPIIDNRPTEDLLAEQLEQAILNYPQCNAVLVRRHGLYVWGDSWEQAKTQCESFDYLFETAVKMKTLLRMDPGQVPKSGSYRVGADAAATAPPNKRSRTNDADNTKSDDWNAQSARPNDADMQRKLVPLLPRDAKILLLDVEGCTTSIAFVKEVLFPYVLEHLDSYVDTLSQNDIIHLNNNLRYQVLQAGGPENLTQPQHPFDLSSSRQRAKDCVRFLMKNDVKEATLKELQGNMWKVGYESGLIRGHVYSDVPAMLNWMKQCNVDVYIYSSGSIQAQKLLFGRSTAGNLCSLIKGHFDITTAGRKIDMDSYHNIVQEIGRQVKERSDNNTVINPGDIVFVSDAEAELVAAQSAGLIPIMSIRPGNAPLTLVGQAFPAIHSLLQLCGE